MARYAHARNNFLFGEVSPRSFARTDLDQYAQMCKSLENFTVLPQGGVRKRLGTAYVTDITSAHSTVAQSKVIPYRGASKNYFIVGSTGTRIDMFTRDGGTTDDFTIVASTGLTASFNWSNICYTQYGALLVVTNGQNYPLVIYVDTSEVLHAFYIGDGKVVASSQTSNGFKNIVTALAGYLPWDIENTGDPAVSSITMTPSVTTGTGTLTASGAYFQSNHVGTFIRTRHTSTVGYCLITGYTSTTVVNIQVFKTLGGTGAATAWSECQWGRRGFPRSCSFYQERLMLGGSSGFPERIWGSQIGDLYEFSNEDPTASFDVGDDAAFYLDMANGSNGIINALSPGKKLFANSSEEEIVVKELNQDFGIGILNTGSSVETREGAYYAMPARHNNKLMFINRSGKSVIENAFDFNEDSYKNTDLTTFSEHLFALGNISTTETLKEIAWQTDQRILWAITTAGNLYSLTRNEETGAFGWSRHYLGGALSTGDPIVRSICVLNNRDYGFDEVILLVSRTVNSSTKFYVERIGPEPSDYQDVEDIPDYFMDCSIMDTNGSPQTTWTAVAAHLANETVDVVADGSYVGTYTLNASGTLVLDDAASTVAVGYAYTGNIVPTALQSNSLFGSGLGQIKRTEEVTLIFDKTVGGSIGAEDSTLTDIEFRESTVAADDPTPLFTGEKTLKIDASYRTQQYIQFQHTPPLPCTICGMVFKGILYD